MIRRLFPLLFMVFMTASGGTGHAQPSFEPSWEEFKERFVTVDGRVVDRNQDMVSHSEGQAYGMILAVEYNDRSAFDTIWQWTRENLQVRGHDNLLAWLWGRRTDDQWAVIDLNNATDGDILTAMALLRAARKWPGTAYSDQALALLQSIRELCTVRIAGRLCLLPGYYGFLERERAVLNPSYFIPTALKLFAAEDAVEHRPFWQTLLTDSRHIVSQSVFGPLHLPPDWVVFSGDGVRLDDSRDPFFGHDAIRVFLYAAWDGSLNDLPGTQEILHFVTRKGYVPLRVDLEGDQASLHSGPGSHLSILARIARDTGHDKLAQDLAARAAQSLKTRRDDYYSYVLTLLSMLEHKP